MAKDFFLHYFHGQKAVSIIMHQYSIFSIFSQLTYLDEYALSILEVYFLLSILESVVLKVYFSKYT